MSDDNRALLRNAIRNWLADRRDRDGKLWAGNEVLNTLAADLVASLVTRKLIP